MHTLLFEMKPSDYVVAKQGRTIYAIGILGGGTPPRGAVALPGGRWLLDRQDLWEMDLFGTTVGPVLWKPVKETAVLGLPVAKGGVCRIRKTNPAHHIVVRLFRSTFHNSVLDAAGGAGKIHGRKLDKSDRHGSPSSGVHVTTVKDDYCRVRSIPIEEVHAKAHTVRQEAVTREAFRREQSLVLRFKKFLEGPPRNWKPVRHEYRGGFKCDAYLPEKNLLIEAKGLSNRESLRMAIGQLLDYRELESGKARRARLCILLRCPPPDDASRPMLMRLLRRIGIELAWPEGTGFFCSLKDAFKP